MKNYVKNGNVTSWIYEFNMWNNPTILLTVWKVLMFSSLVPALVVFLVSLSDGFVDAMLSFFKIYGVVGGIITVLTFALAYPIVCLMYGGKYIVVFEMDKNGIRHSQMRSQFKKAECLALIGTLVGAAKGNFTLMGSSMLAGSKNSMYSDFSCVRKVFPIRERNTIKIFAINGMNNQIYVDAEHFDEILDSIRENCPRIKK